ncbi:protein mono-ADP-ribosyltransferase PARP14 isoform X2 [Patella vulgata]|uniref:protein mono-ADP-ribosyltransferase PARP14 isoform X2 n=1 Tax=Patella vulgata TaxID=6465 RepID=UPI0024A8D4BD|nr:protein mono-ADP-ribosyltransferase PARP14 isoform X2 [Patella vulgata]
MAKEWHKASEIPLGDGEVNHTTDQQTISPSTTSPTEQNCAGETDPQLTDVATTLVNPNLQFGQQPICRQPNNLEKDVSDEDDSHSVDPPDNSSGDSRSGTFTEPNFNHHDKNKEEMMQPSLGGQSGILSGDNLYIHSDGPTTENKTSPTEQIKPQIQANYQPSISDSTKMEITVTNNPVYPIPQKQPNSMQSDVQLQQKKHPESKLRNNSDICGSEDNLKTPMLNEENKKDVSTNMMTLKVTGFDFQTTDEMIKLYFDNKKKSGASAENIQISKDDGYALVTYSTYEDTAIVLERNHTLNSQLLTVKAYEEEVLELKSIKVSGFKTANFELMDMYFTNMKACGAEAETVELSENKEYLLVTFSTTEEAELVCSREHILDGCNLKVEIFDPSTQDNSTHDDGKRIVCVSGYKDTISKQMIEMHIESEKRFGAVAENIDIKEEEKCTFVTLSTEKETNILEVSKLPNDVTQEALSMFFEKKKLAQDAKLLAVDLNKKENKAFLKYDKSDAVKHISKKEVVQFHGSDVCVKPFTGDVKIEKENKTLKITDFNPNTSVEMIDMYFESKKRSGASAEEVKSFKEDGYTLVTYSTIDDVTIVLSRDHILDGETLTVQYYEEEIPELKAIKVSGFKSTSFQLMELYFENQKKCGAEAEKVELSEDKTYLLVTFDTTEEAELVCSRKHILDGCELIVEIFNPSTQDNSTHDDGKIIVCVSGYKDTTSKQMIEMYLESKKRFGAVAENIEINQQEKCAYVTLSSERDAKLVCSREHILDDYNLTVEIFNPSTQLDNSTHDDGKRIVRVSGYKDTSSKQMIEMYLESEKRFGAVVENIEINQEEKCAYVTLSAEKDVNQVCTRDHNLDDCYLKVELLDQSNYSDKGVCSSDSDNDDDDAKPCIKVSGCTNLKKLKKYIRNKDKFGVAVDSIETVREEMCIYVSLSTKEDIDTVCNTSHTVDNCPLLVEIYKTQKSSVTDLGNCQESNLKEGVDTNKTKLRKEDASSNIEQCVMASNLKSEDVNLSNTKQENGASSKIKSEDECVDIPDAEDQHCDKCVCVQISGYGASVSEQKLTVYIKNKRKFGAAPKDIKFDSDDNCVYVTLASKKDAENVCSRTHQVGNYKVNVKLYTPPPQLNNRLLVTNISQETNKEMLQNFLEGKFEIEILNIVYNDEADKAMISFDENEVTVDEILCKVDMLKGPLNYLDGKQLHISTINTSKTAKVKQHGVKLDEDDLTNCFESYEANISRIEMNDIDNFALVHFETYDDLKKVLAKSREDKENELEVEVYQKCLGKSGGIKDPDVFILPTPVNVTLTGPDSHKVLFIYQSKTNKQQLCDKLAEYNILVEWNKDKPRDVQLSCTVTKDMKDARKLTKIWTTLCEINFRKFLDGIQLKVIPIANPKVLELVSKETKISNKDDVIIMKESDSVSSIIVVGQDAPQFKELTSTVQNTIHRIEEELKRQQEECTQPMELEYPSSTLETFGVIDRIKGKHELLNFTLKPAEKKIVFKGIMSEIMSAKATIHEFWQNLKVTELTGLANPIVELLLKQDVRDHIMNQLKTQEHKRVVWEGNGNNTSVIVFAENDENLKRITGLLNTVCVNKLIDVDSKISDLLAGSAWNDLIKNIEAQYPNLVKVNVIDNKYISLTSISEVFKLIEDPVSDFIKENVRCVETLNCSKGQFDLMNGNLKSDVDKLMSDLRADKIDVKMSQLIGIRIEGPQEAVERGSETLSSFMSKIKCKDKTVTKPSELKFYRSDKGREAITTTQKKFKCLIKNSDEAVDINTIFQLRKTKIHVINGDITDSKVDVIVNPSDKTLNHSGGLADAIVRKGGNIIQIECQKYVRSHGSLSDGECIMSNPGNLSCKRIIHTVGPKWHDGKSDEVNVLKDTILRVLEMAMTNAYTSVAMPAIGTGLSEFPFDQASVAIINAIGHHFERVPNSPIHTIYLIDKQQKPLEHIIANLQENPVFRQISSNERQARHVAHSSQPRSSTQKQIGPPTEQILHTVKNEIAKVKADVIVNSTSSKLELKAGAVSGSILRVGGAILQTECDQKYPNGIGEGDIAETGSGNLQCRQVYHTCLRHYSGISEEKELEKLIHKCLERAQKAGYTSIAFPAIGTGNLRFPHNVVARIFYKAINDYKSHGGSLQNITIVIYPRDLQTIKAFENLLSNNEEHRVKDRSVKGAEGFTTLTGPVTVSGNDLSQGVYIGKLLLKVNRGDILKVGVDAIVNGSNRSLDLSKGAVSVAILKMGGSELQQEYKKEVPTMEISGIATTSVPPGMKCKHIIHIDVSRWGSDLKNGIIKCLKEAEKRNCASIAFPALGAGIGAGIEDVAKAVFNAVSETSKELSHVNVVEVVVYQQSMLGSFNKTFKTFLNENKQANSGGEISRFSFTNILSSIGSAFSSNSSSPPNSMQKPPPACNYLPYTDKRTDKTPITFHIYFFDEHNTGETGRIVSTELDELYSSAACQRNYPLKDLSSDKQRDVERLTNNFPVEVEINQHLRNVKVHGLSDDILEVHEIIMSMIDNAFREKNEEEHQRMQNGVKLAGLDTRIPKHWSNRTRNDINIEELKKSSDEYKIVEKNFKATLGTLVCSIEKIERIENKPLYQQYASKKLQMIQELTTQKDVEKDVLWHGTVETSVDNINHGGFNRGYSGKNATCFGQGAYFAVNSSYSAQSKYAKPDNNGVCRMYQCRVLVGEYTRGESHLKRPPPKKSNSEEEYNSMVDNLRNPTMYVVCHDAQAYPDYLIYYKHGA